MNVEQAKEALFQAIQKFEAARLEMKCAEFRLSSAYALQRNEDRIRGLQDKTPEMVATR